MCPDSLATLIQIIENTLLLIPEGLIESFLYFFFYLLYL